MNYVDIGYSFSEHMSRRVNACYSLCTLSQNFGCMHICARVYSTSSMVHGIISVYVYIYIYIHTQGMYLYMGLWPRNVVSTHG